MGGLHSDAQHVGDDNPAVPRTDAALFREIRAATVFDSADPAAMHRWVGALSGLIEELFVVGRDDDEFDVLVRFACRFLDADVAILSVPLDAETMQVARAAGVGADKIVGNRFDLRRSIDGRVLESGLVAYIGALKMKSPIAAIEMFGPMVVASLRSGDLHATLSVGRLHDRAGLSLTDLDRVVGFAKVAGLAMDVRRAMPVEEARGTPAEHARRSSEFLAGLIRDLFDDPETNDERPLYS